MLYNATERNLWWYFTLVNVMGWAAFLGNNFPISLLGVVIITVGQWAILHGRVPEVGYWLLITPICLLSGVTLGGVFGGILQDWIDNIPEIKIGIAYLSPGRTSLGYFIAQTFAGAFIGCLLGLGQWLVLLLKVGKSSIWLFANIIGLAIGSALYAVYHVIIQRSIVGVFLSAVTAGVFTFLGANYPSPDIDTFLSNFLSISSVLLESVIVSIILSTSVVWCLRGQASKEPNLNRTAVISFCMGVLAVLALVLGVALLQVNPPEPGHYSAMFSPAANLILFLSLASFILGPLALSKGIVALKQIAKCEDTKKGKTLAWIGVILGGMYALLLTGTIFLMILFMFIA